MDQRDRYRPHWHPGREGGVSTRATAPNGGRDRCRCSGTFEISALFLTADISLIKEWARKLQPAILHLGAAPELLGPHDFATLKRNLPDMLLMRSIPVVSEASIEIARTSEGIADFLLADFESALRLRQPEITSPRAVYAYPDPMERFINLLIRRAASTRTRSRR